MGMFGIFLVFGRRCTPFSYSSSSPSSSFSLPTCFMYLMASYFDPRISPLLKAFDGVATWDGAEATVALKGIL